MKPRKVTRSNVRRIVWVSGRAGCYELNIDNSRLVSPASCFWGQISFTDWKTAREMQARIRAALIGMPMKDEA